MAEKGASGERMEQGAWTDQGRQSGGQDSAYEMRVLEGSLVSVLFISSGSMREGLAEGRKAFVHQQV